MEEIDVRREIAERKSVTNWTQQPIAPEIWETLLEAARSAPSSWNRQPARYVIVTEQETRRQVCQALHRINRFAAHAPGLMIQVACPEDDEIIDGKPYYLYDCGLAMMSIVLQAQSLGLTARQMAGFDETDVKRILNIPDRYRVVIAVGIGYPSTNRVSTAIADAKRHITSQHKRIARSELASFGRWMERESQ